MKIKTSKDLKIGDLVSVNYTAPSHSDRQYKWTGICNWGDGYKFSFYVVSSTDNRLTEITWTINDLREVGAEVISESR